MSPLPAPFEIWTFWILFGTFCPGYFLQSEDFDPSQCKDGLGFRDRSFLWRIESDPPSFLFGTIHVPYTRVWDYLPASTKSAFAQADYVYFELDLSAPWTVTALDDCQRLSNGQTLEEVLPGNLVKRLEAHFKYLERQSVSRWGSRLSHALSGGWKYKRPVWIMLLLNSLSEGELRSHPIPILDLYLAQEAGRRNKPTGAVEEVREQCLPLNQLGLSQVVFALNSTLRRQEQAREEEEGGERGKRKKRRERGGGDSVERILTEDLIHHYNCRNLDEALFNRDTSQVRLHSKEESETNRQQANEIESYFWRELILKRNLRMGERVASIVKKDPGRSYFFAFGAGHFLGNFTVLDVIRSRGLRVEVVGPEEQIDQLRKRPLGGSLSSHSKTVPLGSSLLPRRTCYSYPCENLQRHFSQMFQNSHVDDLSKAKAFNDLWIQETSPFPVRRPSPIPFGALTSSGSPLPIKKRLTLLATLLPQMTSLLIGVMAEGYIVQNPF